MTTVADSDLHAINHAIGEAESTADRGFFERLLAPAFSMVRPDGTRFDDRTGFLDALTVGPARRTRVDSITVFDNRAVAVCAVMKELPDGAATAPQHPRLQPPEPGRVMAARVVGDRAAPRARGAGRGRRRAGRRRG